MLENIKEITFGIVTYNSATTVVELLESIKYQINTYGNGIKCSVVLADDCSKDNTFQIAKIWLEENDSLFVRVSLLKSENNEGVSANYSKVIEQINTTFFVGLAGDDVISSINIFEQLEQMKKNEVFVFFPTYYDGEKLTIKEDSVARQIYYQHYKHTSKRDIRLVETLSPFLSTQIMLRRELYTDECLEYMRKYHNFEDDTSLYYIFKNNKDIVFSYKESPFVLYRRDGSSLTSSVDTISQIRFLDDLHRFRKETLKAERYLPTKIIILMRTWESFLMKHRFSAEHTLYRIVRGFIDKRRVNIGLKYSEYDKIREDIYLFLETEVEYVNKIRKTSEEFLKRVNDSCLDC